MHSQAKERSTCQLYLVAFWQKGNLSLHARLARISQCIEKIQPNQQTKEQFLYDLQKWFLFTLSLVFVNWAE